MNGQYLFGLHRYGRPDLPLQPAWLGARRSGLYGRRHSGFPGCRGCGQFRIGRPRGAECGSGQQLEDAEAAADAAKAAADAAAAKAAADAAAAARNANTLSPYSIVFYDYSMSKLTPKEKTRLELMADVIKDGRRTAFTPS